MNVRQQIVENLKTEKNTTVAAIAKATGIVATTVRYHLKAMAKNKIVKVARGSAGPNGSAGVTLLDAKAAGKDAATWVPRAGGRRHAASLGGGKRKAARRAGGKPANGIGTSPKLTDDSYLVVHDLEVQNGIILGVSIFALKEDAVSAAVANKDARVFVGREVKVAHTLVEG